MQKLTKIRKRPVILPSLPNPISKRTVASYQFSPEQEENDAKKKNLRRNIANLSTQSCIVSNQMMLLITPMQTLPLKAALLLDSRSHNFCLCLYLQARLWSHRSQGRRTGQDNLNMPEIKVLLRKPSLCSTKVQKFHSGSSGKIFYARRATFPPTLSPQMSLSPQMFARFMYMLNEVLSSEHKATLYINTSDRLLLRFQRQCRSFHSLPFLDSHLFF